MTSQSAVPPSGAGSAPAPNPILSFVPMIVVVLILYVLIIRPQQKQAKEHKLMLNNLKVGDRILITGGLFGTVSALKGQVVQVKIADNVKVDVSRGAISQVITQDPSASEGVRA